MRLLIFATALIVAHHAGAQDLARHEFESVHMGTKFRIVLYSAEPDTAKRSADAAFALAEDLNAHFSDYDADSELMRLTQKREAEVSEELFDILARARALAKETGGAFDITTGAHTRNWRRARITGTLPSAASIAAAKRASGWQKLDLDPETRRVTLTVPGMFLDLGGIAKGFTADAMLKLLKDRGHPIASVAAGGDVAVGDPPPGKAGWRVGIAPDGEKNSEVVVLANQAVSTSGQAEQKVTIDGKSYSHIVDPKTGLGLTGSAPVSVIAELASDTDPLATALSVMGEKRGRAYAKKKGIRAEWPDR
jgi:thiamine biosynthesis lipoprotein